MPVMVWCILTGVSALLLWAQCAKFNSRLLQFFITVAETPWLNGRHVVFGKLLEGRDVVQRIEMLPVDRASRPQQRVQIVQSGVLT